MKTYASDVDHSNPLAELLKAKAYIDSLPKLPKLEIWLSRWFPKGNIAKMPAMQNGERVSYSDFADVIWIMNEDDFNHLDVLHQNNNGVMIPVFRPGGIPVIGMV